MRYARRLILLCISALLFPSLAFSYSECETSVNRIWNGNDGNNWLLLSNGLNVELSAADVDTKGITAAAMAALLAGKSVTLRFVADGVPCNATGNIGTKRTDVMGLWLNKN